MVCLLAAMLFSRVAAAAESPSTVVVVFPVAAAGWTERLESALRAHTRDMGVRFIVVDGQEIEEGRARDLASRMDRAARLANERSASFTFFFDRDPSHPSNVSVSLFESQGTRLFVRDVPVVDGAEGAATEALATIVRSSLEGYASPPAPAPAPEIQTANPPPPAPAPAPAPEPAKPERTRSLLPLEHRSADSPAHVRLAGYYTGNAYSRQIAWQSGVRLGAAWLLSPNFYVGGGYAYYPNTDVHSEVVTLRISRHVGELFVGSEFRRGRFGIGGEIGVLADATMRSTRGPVPGLSATPDTSAWSPGGRAQVLGSWNWLPTSRLLVAAGVDVYPMESAYVVEFPKAEMVLSPRLIRPRVEMGVSFDL